MLTPEQRAQASSDGHEWGRDIEPGASVVAILSHNVPWSHVAGVVIGIDRRSVLIRALDGRVRRRELQNVRRVDY